MRAENLRIYPSHKQCHLLPPTSNSKKKLKKRLGKEKGKAETLQRNDSRVPCARPRTLEQNRDHKERPTGRRTTIGDKKKQHPKL